MNENDLDPALNICSNRRMLRDTMHSEVWMPLHTHDNRSALCRTTDAPATNLLLQEVIEFEQTLAGRRQCSDDERRRCD